MMLERLSPQERRAVWETCSYYKTLELGTICSGTECPRLALAWLEEAVSASLGPDFGDATFKVCHTMSCDLNFDKRAFIREMARPGVLFGSAQELVASKAANYAKEEQKAKGPMAAVPEVDMVVAAGFPCKY
eukprot:6797158-Lingulodinium_polyedra.AAC.1